MVLVLCTLGRFCVCELNGNRGERCGVACYICRRKKDQNSWEGVHSKVRERERERERERGCCWFFILCILLGK
ncbi:hypothetical protein ACJW30_06G193500 [Castanea mollissima]